MKLCLQVLCNLDCQNWHSSHEQNNKTLLLKKTFRLEGYWPPWWDTERLQSSATFYKRMSCCGTLRFGPHSDSSIMLNSFLHRPCHWTRISPRMVLWLFCKCNELCRHNCQFSADVMLGYSRRLVVSRCLRIVRQDADNYSMMHDLKVSLRHSPLQTGSKLASDFHFHLLSKIEISVLCDCAPASTPVGNATELNKQTCCFLGGSWMEAKNQKAYYVGKLNFWVCPSHYAKKATSLFGSIADGKTKHFWTKFGYEAKTSIL